LEEVAERTGLAPAALSAFAGRGEPTLETTAEAAHCAAMSTCDETDYGKRRAMRARRA